MDIKWYSVGNYLEIHYSERIQEIERKLCNCVEEEFKPQGNPYPLCVLLFFDTRISRVYWKTIVDELKVDYPEIVMELYLLDIHY